MKQYLVTLAARPDGGGSSQGFHVFAYSEFHACQLAQGENPGWYAVSAVLS
jgi:hypothetical protein